MTVDCRVRKLSIRLEEPATLSRAAFLLEEALRTAAFPGIPANGLVFVKRMHLGRFDTATGSGGLSRKIDALIRNLRPVKVHRFLPADADPPAVWFADALDACRLLIEQLAAGHTPRNWFWPVAVPGWRPDAPPARGLQGVMLQAAGAPAGLQGLAHVTAPLVSTGRIFELLDAFEDAAVETLLQSMGEPPRVGLKAAPSPEDDIQADQAGYGEDIFGPAENRSIVARSVRRWGAANPRSVLAMALVDAGQKGRWGAGQGVQLPVSAMVAEVRPGRAPKASSSAPKDDLTAVTAAGPPVAEEAPTPEARPTAARSAGAAHAGAGPWHAEAAGDVPGDRTMPDPLNAVEGIQVGEMPAVEPAIRPNAGPLRPPALPAVLAGRPDVAADNAGTEQALADHPFAGDPSRFAGFFMLINVLERLGIENILENGACDPTGDLCEAVLWRLAHSCKVPPDDPAVSFLRDPAEIAVAGSQWTKRPTRRDFYEKIHPRQRALFRGPRGGDATVPLDFAQVVDMVVPAVARYIRRRAGMRIVAVIRRPAWIAVTRTHLDVTLPMRALDIRIRMAGLDFNPGWVPWLRRVIQFHYTEEEIGA